MPLLPGTWRCCSGRGSMSARGARQRAPAQNGHLEALRWARQHGCPCPPHLRSMTCMYSPRRRVALRPGPGAHPFPLAGARGHLDMRGSTTARRWNARGTRVVCSRRARTPIAVAVGGGARRSLNSCSAFTSSLFRLNSVSGLVSKPVLPMPIRTVSRLCESSVIQRVCPFFIIIITDYE